MQTDGQSQTDRQIEEQTDGRTDSVLRLCNFSNVNKQNSRLCASCFLYSLFYPLLSLFGVVGREEEEEVVGGGGGGGRGVNDA